MRAKESGTVRYAYGVATALLLGGTAFSLATGSAGAQVAQNAPAVLAPGGAPQSFADLAAKLQPAVVNISTRQRVPVRSQADPLEEFFRRFGFPDGGQGGQQGTPRTRETGSLGSGFIISPDGYIVTNNHLIQSATGNGTVDEITVTMTNRKEYPARIVGRDSASDLALLKIDGQNLPFVRWGDSTHARVGDWVLAVGNPYGLGGSVTAGIISALHRGITGAGAYDRYIQTDAAINMGNSGGPMFDLDGNVIGINSALISPTGASVGIGLAIPAELAKPVIDSLRRGMWTRMPRFSIAAASARCGSGSPCTRKNLRVDAPHASANARRSSRSACALKAFSTSTREAGDVSAGVFDGQGGLLAQAVTGTRGHVNSMARSVVHFLDVFPTQTMRDGDAYITNDPWKATGHLHDLTIVSPAFRSVATAPFLTLDGSGEGPFDLTLSPG